MRNLTSHDDAATVAGSAPQVEPALAEGRWLWRRLYVFSASAALWLLLRTAVLRAGPADLPRIADGLMSLLALMLLLYLVAPSAQQIVNLTRLRSGGGA